MPLQTQRATYTGVIAHTYHSIRSAISAVQEAKEPWNSLSSAEETVARFGNGALLLCYMVVCLTWESVQQDQVDFYEKNAFLSIRDAFLAWEKDLSAHPHIW